MVKSIRALLLVAVALAGISGCNLGIGIFPDRLKSCEGYVDLSKSIDKDRIRDFKFQIIRDSRTTSGNPEYLVLANDNRDFSGVHVMIFDTLLGVLGKYTIDELDAMDPGSPFGGRCALVAANGDIIVGNRSFTVSAGHTAYVGTTPTALYAPGLALPEAAQPNLVNIWTENLSSVFFNYIAFSLDWTANSIWSPVFLGGMSKADIRGLWLRDTDVIALIAVEGQGTRIHLLDRAALAVNALCTPIHDCYAGSLVFGENDPWWDTLGYTDAGFAAFYDYPQRKYVLFGTDGQQIDASAEVSGDDDWPNEQRQVYGRTEGWYILRMKDMTLERRAWWWL